MIGSICRNAWGNSMRNRVLVGVRPIARPASRWPLGSDAMPARSASPIRAPLYTARAATTAQKAPVENTSRMNSIISSTGMPRKNSSTTVVGTRTQRDLAVRRNENTTPMTTARTDAIAAACRVETHPRPMARHRARSPRMSHRDPSRTPGVTAPFALTRGRPSR
jgi:hypothetical protein